MSNFSPNLQQFSSKSTLFFLLALLFRHTYHLASVYTYCSFLLSCLSGTVCTPGRSVRFQTTLETVNCASHKCTLWSGYFCYRLWTLMKGVTSFSLVVRTRIYGHLITDARMQIHGNAWALNKWKTNKQTQGNTNKHENSNLQIIGWRMAPAVCRWLVWPLSLAVCGKRWDFPMVSIVML